MRYRGHSITHRSACALPLTLFGLRSALRRWGILLASDRLYAGGAKTLQLQPRPRPPLFLFLPPFGAEGRERREARSRLGSRKFRLRRASPTGGSSSKRAAPLWPPIGFTALGHPPWPPIGFTPKGVEIKAERRKPSGEKPCDIEDTPSLTGVLAHFRSHSLASDRLYAGGAKTLELPLRPAPPFSSVRPSGRTEPMFS